MSSLIGFTLPFQKEAFVIGNALECASCIWEVKETVNDRDINALCKIHVTAANSLHLLAKGCELHSVLKNHNSDAIAKLQVVVTTTRCLKDVSQLVKKKHKQGELEKIDYLQPLISIVSAGLVTVSYFFQHGSE